MPEICGTAVLAPVSYVTSTCAECGKTFECSRATRYRIGRNVYCSYKCFRPDDKKRREKALAAIEREDSVVRANVAYYAKKKKQNTLEVQIEKLEKRVELCIQKVDYYRDLYSKAIGRRPRGKARENMRKWVMKKAAAEDALRLLRLKGERQNVQDQGIHEGHGQDNAPSYAR